MPIAQVAPACARLVDLQQEVEWLGPALVAGRRPSLVAGGRVCIVAQFLAVCRASILAVERRIGPLFTSPDGMKIGGLLQAHAFSNSPTSVPYKV